MTEHTGRDRITVAQLLMARAGLGWSQERAGQAAGVPLRVYQGVKEGRYTGIAAPMKAIRSALEQAGVEFIG